MIISRLFFVAVSITFGLLLPPIVACVCAVLCAASDAWGTWLSHKEELAELELPKVDLYAGLHNKIVRLEEDLNKLSLQFMR